jgi:hypothetical protein
METTIIQPIEKMIKHSYTLKNGEVREKFYPQNQYNKKHYLKHQEKYNERICCNDCEGHYKIQNKTKHINSFRHKNSLEHKKYKDYYNSMTISISIEEPQQPPPPNF